MTRCTSLKANTTEFELIWICKLNYLKIKFEFSSYGPSPIHKNHPSPYNDHHSHEEHSQASHRCHRTVAVASCTSGVCARARVPTGYWVRTSSTSSLCSGGTTTPEVNYGLDFSYNKPHIPMYHYSDFIMSVMASQITGISIVRLGSDQREHQSSMSVAFVRGSTGNR